jgi:hypothetical protein
LTNGEPRPLNQNQLHLVLALAAVGLIIFGVKVFLIEKYGSPIPYWDQWDAEADLLYKPYISGKLGWATLLSAHNEHRILLSRLFSIGLFEAAGGWDPILQMVVNAALHVVAIIFLMFTILRILDRSRVLPMSLFVVLVFTLPLGWENLLAGFQSQFYFLLIFSILSLVLLTVSQALSGTWWAGFFSSIAAFFSMASGALVVVTAFSIVAIQIIVGVRRNRRDYLAACILLAAAGAVLLYIPSIAGHDGLKAHNLQDLMDALLTCLEFPRRSPHLGIWINLPLAIYLPVTLFRRPPRESPHWIIFGLGIWWLSQVLSLSYGRAAVPTTSRYQDIIIIALPLNFGILLFAFDRVQKEFKLAFLSGMGGWLIVVVTALLFSAYSSAFPEVQQKAAQGHEQLANVIEYLRTGNIDGLKNKPFLAVPYPIPERLASLLSDSNIKLILPDTITPPGIDLKSRIDQTILKGRARATVQWIKLGLLQSAMTMIGLGISCLFVFMLVYAGLKREVVASQAGLKGSRSSATFYPLDSTTGVQTSTKDSRS